MGNNNWEEKYKLAKQYYDSNGDLLVPLKYTTSDGSHLGYWIGTQRRNYIKRKLSKEKIELLEKIGMIWSIYELQWYEYYELLLNYYNLNGNSLVPIRYITNNKRLGYWVSHQRIKYKSKELSEDKIILLEKVDMVWDPADKTWNATYEIAKQYYDENNTLNIPNTFFYKSVSLGSWILTQRNNYAQKLLTDKQIRMLNNIGMEWNPIRSKEYIWENNYKKVIEFYKKYKHLYIPTNYLSKDGVNIGRWLYEQKLKYNRNELDEYRKSKLDLLDKSWLEPSNSKSSFPEQAVLFYIKKFFPSATKLRTKKISEIDIYIPEMRTGIEYDGPVHIGKAKKDILKSNACKEQGINLIRIRDCECPILDDDSHKIILKNGSFEALDEGITELLQFLRLSDIDVNVKRDYIEISDNYIKSVDSDWYNMYEKLKEYYNCNGNIDVPIYYKTSDGFLLGHWLSNMRNSRKNPSLKGTRLNSHKIELLEELGMDWFPIESQWKNNYFLAEKYYKENGNLLICDTYIANDHVKLGRWIATQRNSYKEKTLPEEKIILLEKIGMVWDVADYRWKKAYFLAEEYYKDNKNLLIPNNYVTNSGFSLGSWIGHQRSKHKNQKLPQEKIELLEKIGMKW